MFNHLPFNLIEHIISYTCYVRQPFSKKKPAVRNYTYAVHFLTLCHSWRTVALSLLLNNVTLGTRNDTLAVITDYPISPYPASSTHLKWLENYTRHVTINAGLTSFTNENIATVLDQIDKSGCVFTQCHSVSIALVDFDIEKGIKGNDIIDFIQLFVEAAYKYIPEISNIYIKLPAGKGGYNFSMVEHKNQLGFKLLPANQNPKIENFTSNKEFYYQTKPAIVLTCLSILCDVNFTYFCQIAQQNANTLTKLVLELCESNNVKQILSGLNGELVCYPALKYLTIDSVSNQQIEMTNMPLNWTPLPALEYLVVDGMYPFTSDILLRDCHKTLKTLSLYLNRDTIRMIEASNLYKSNNSERLTKIKGNIVSGTYEENIHIYDVLFIMAKHAKTLYISEQGVNNLGQPFITSLKQYSGNLNITSLEMPDKQLQVSEIISIGRMIPSLNSICCKPDSLNSSFLIATDEYIEQYFDSIIVNSNLSTLKSWRISYNPYISHKMTILIAVVLCIAFPGLSIVAPEQYFSENYKRLIKGVLNKRPFEKYKHMLWGLLQE